MARDVEAIRRQSLNLKSGEDAQKMLKKIAAEMLKYQKGVTATNKSIEDQTDSLNKLIKAHIKTEDAIKSATGSAEKFAKTHKKEFDSLTDSADQFGRANFSDLRKSITGVRTEFWGVDAVLNKLDKFTGFDKTRVAMKDTEVHMKSISSLFKEQGLDVGTYNGDDAHLKEAQSAYRIHESNKKALDDHHGGVAGTIDAGIIKSADMLDSIMVKLGIDAELTLAVVAAGLDEAINLQSKLQKEISFSNVGWGETLDYITQINQAVEATNGLVDIEGATKAFVDLQGKFRDFTAEGSNVVQTSTRLTAAIGYSSEAFADLAAEYKTLGIKDVDGGLKSAANTMVYFAKNTNLNTGEIEAMINASKPLMEIYPSQLQNRLLPQLLSIAAAFKEIGLDSADAAKQLEEMADFSSPEGMLKAAFASQGTGGKLSIDDILSGTNPGLAIEGLSQSVRNMVQQISGGDVKKMEFAAQQVSKLMGVPLEEARRFGKMTTEQMDLFRKRIDQEQDYAKQQTALSDALSQQMEGPINQFKGLWNELKTVLMQVGVAASDVLEPAFLLVSLGVKGLTAILKPIEFLLEKVGTGFSMLWDALGLGESSMAALGKASDAVSGWMDQLPRAWDYIESWILDGLGSLIEQVGNTLSFIPNLFVKLHNSIPVWARKLLHIDTADEKMVDVFGLKDVADTFYMSASQIRKTADDDYKRKQDEKNDKGAVTLKNAFQGGPETSYSKYLRTGNLAEWKAVEGTDKEIHAIPDTPTSDNVGSSGSKSAIAPIADNVGSSGSKSAIAPIEVQTNAEKSAKLPVVNRPAPPTTDSTRSRESTDERKRRQQEMDSRAERDRFMNELREASYSRLLPPPYQDIVVFESFD